MTLAFAIIMTLIAFNSGAAERGPGPDAKSKAPEIYLSAAREPITKLEVMKILLKEPRSEVLKCWAVELTERGTITKK